MFCGGLIVYISKKMPEFNDKIYLHKEGKLLSFMWIIATSFYGFVSILEMCIGRTLITFFISELASMMGSFSMSFISTYWVIKQVELSNILNNLEMAVVGDVSKSRPSQSQTEVPSTTSTRNDGYVTLQMLLSDKDLFGLYMQHLLKEFSMECLLAVIEFTQFKKHAIETFNANKMNIDIDITNTESKSKYPARNKLLIFPECVPLSDIVYGYGTEDLSINVDLNSPTNSETDKTLLLLFKDKAHRLYHKYIAFGSGFEINISYKMRAELGRLLHEYHQCINNDELKERELINIFDQCIDEMIQLLKASKSRFLAQNRIHIKKHKICCKQTDEQDSF